METRLVSLERRCRFLTVAVIAIPAVTMLLGAARESSFDLVRTKALVIEDNDGNVRIGMVIAKTGTAMIGFQRPGEKNESMSIQGTVDGTTRQVFYDPKGNSRIAIAATKDGEAAIAITDAKGKVIESLGDL